MTRAKSHDNGRKLEEARIMRQQLSDTFCVLDQITVPTPDPAPSLGSVLLSGDSKSRLSVESILSRLATTPSSWPLSSSAPSSHSAPSSSFTAAPSTTPLPTPVDAAPMPQPQPQPLHDRLQTEHHPQYHSTSMPSMMMAAAPPTAFPALYLSHPGGTFSRSSDGALPYYPYPYRPYPAVDPLALMSAPAYAPSTTGSVPAYSEEQYAMLYQTSHSRRPARVPPARRSLDEGEALASAAGPPVIHRSGSGQAVWPQWPQQQHFVAAPSPPFSETLAPDAVFQPLRSPCSPALAPSLSPSFGIFSPGASSTSGSPSLESLGSDSSSLFVNSFFGDSTPDLATFGGLNAQQQGVTPPREKKRRKCADADDHATATRPHSAADAPQLEEEEGTRLAAADWCGSTASPTSFFNRSMWSLPQILSTDPASLDNLPYRSSPFWYDHPPAVPSNTDLFSASGSAGIPIASDDSHQGGLSTSSSSAADPPDTEQ